eukprot:TRINITY_DN50591_c0_g1_i1.p1 TRINITY_DN50591_c0_g1~~TRINITY_DN50591_c0_g1_i1.p1  ORF type:complete len:307 (-),score=84.64 TRINITY_DN50591_c0_g1_i1:51-971(-)
MYAAAMQGHRSAALAAAEELIHILPRSVLEDTTYFEGLGVGTATATSWLESFIGQILHIHIRFGDWETILGPAPFGAHLALETVEENPGLFAATTAFLHYARGVAHAVLAADQRDPAASNEHIKCAVAEVDAFEAARAVVAAKDMYILMNYDTVDLLHIASLTLQGEVQYRLATFGHAELQPAYELLRQAEAKDCELPYDEPWGWMVPAGHALGALLLEGGKCTGDMQLVAEAEQVFRRDLGAPWDESPRARCFVHPHNPWALGGLVGALEAQQKLVPEELKLAFVEAGQTADVGIKAACMCAVRE